MHMAEPFDFSISPDEFYENHKDNPDWEFGSHVSFKFCEERVAIIDDVRHVYPAHWEIERGSRWLRWIGSTKVERPELTEEDKQWAHFCASVIINDLQPYRTKSMNGPPFSIPTEVSCYVARLCYKKKITRNEMKQFFKEWIDPPEIADETTAIGKVLLIVCGWEPPKQNENEVLKVIREIVTTVPFKGDPKNRTNFYMGQLLKRMKGKITPQEAKELLEKEVH